MRAVGLTKFVAECCDIEIGVGDPIDNDFSLQMAKRISGGNGWIVIKGKYFGVQYARTSLCF